MSKEKILAKFENENKYMDERERKEDVKADLVSLLVITVLSLIAIVIKSDVVFMALVIGVLMSGYGASNLYRYITIRKKRFLMIGIVCAVLGVLFYITFISNALGLI